MVLIEGLVNGYMLYVDHNMFQWFVVSTRGYVNLNDKLDRCVSLMAHC